MEHTSKANIWKTIEFKICILKFCLVLWDSDDQAYSLKRTRKILLYYTLSPLLMNSEYQKFMSMEASRKDCISTSEIG